MKILNRSSSLLFASFVFFGSSLAFANIEFSLMAIQRAMPAIGWSGSAGTGEVVIASGYIKRVDFVQMTDQKGKKQKVTVVTFNESKLPSGDQANDAIYFSDEDAALGLNLSGAIGKMITVNLREQSFTVSDK